MSYRNRRKRGRSRLVVFLLLGVATAALCTHALRTTARPAGLLGRLDVSYTIIDLKSGKLHAAPAVAVGKDGRESLQSMVSRLKPYAAITGTYYDADNRVLGDIVVGGKVVRRGGQRQGIGFTSKGQIRFLERRGKSRMDWTGCRSGLACGPRLVRNGDKDIDVKRDGFSAVAATRKAWRCAAGATKDGKLILCVVTQDVTLSTLGEVMLELGARDAINLDGGIMCALYEDGKYHVQPVARMSNILAVYGAR